MREQRPKLLLIIGSGLVPITLIGLTAWNVLARKAEEVGRLDRAKFNLNPESEVVSEAAPEAVSDAVAESAVPEDGDEVAELAEPSAESPVKVAPMKRTVSQKQVNLENARDRYLAKPVAGEASGSHAATTDGDTISDTDKERALCKVMPFYRSPKKREAPPVSAEELDSPVP